MIAHDNVTVEFQWKKNRESLIDTKQKLVSTLCYKSEFPDLHPLVPWISIFQPVTEFQ